MIEVRIHGRGGQGNVVAAYLLAGAAFADGRFCQAFPAFGAERRGAPVAAFVRIAGAPIRRRCAVREPALVVIQDATLLHTAGVLDGIRAGGGVLINGSADTAELSQRLGCDVIAAPAGEIAQRHLGRPVPNTALLAMLLSLTGVVSVDGLDQAMVGRFSETLLERNRAGVAEAANEVPAGLWREKIDASGA